MKTEAVIATTHLDAHNERFTREALEASAAAINSGRKPLMTIEHDSTIPPYGKLMSARVEKRDDGEYQLVSEGESFDERKWLLLSDGTKLFKEESETNKLPFVDKYESFEADEYIISIDLINFDSFEAGDAFFHEIQGATNVEFAHHEFGRKSSLPDPEIIIKLANSVVMWLLSGYIAKKVADKVLDKIGEEIGEDAAKFYNFAKITIVKYAKYVRPQGRPITYIFVIAKQPRIEFVARTNNPDLVITAILPDKLKVATLEAQHLEKNLGATQIQYLLNAKGEWEFNYLLTKTGGVIGTEKAFSNRFRKMEILLTHEKSSKSDK